MPVSMTATPTPRPVPRYVFQRYGAWIDWLKLVESVSPIACGLIAPFSETARTSGRAASSRAPVAGSLATTALMMWRSRVTVPPSSRTSGAAAVRLVPAVIWTMTSTRLPGVRSAMSARAGVSEGSGAATTGAEPVEGSSAPERAMVAGTMAAIASSAMPIIQRIRKTMFGA